MRKIMRTLYLLTLLLLVGSAVISGAAAETADGIWIVNDGDTISVRPGVTTPFNVVSVVKGDPMKMVSTIPQNQITWTSSNENIGYFQANNEFYAKSTGTTTITAKYNGFTDDLIVNVGTLNPDPNVFNIFPDKVEMYIGEELLFIVDLYDSNLGKKFEGVTPTWTATGGTISGAGVYTAGKSTGTYKVTANYQNHKAEATVLIKAPSVDRIDVNWPDRFAQGSDFSISAEAYDGDIHVKYPGFTWESSNPSVISVTDAANGKFNAKSLGTATITVTSADGKSASHAIEVYYDGSNPVYSIPSLYGNEGQTLSVTATHVSGDSADSYLWRFTSPTGYFNTQTTSSPSTSFTFPSSGSYTVTLTATNTTYGKSGEAKSTISVSSSSSGTNTGGSGEMKYTEGDQSSSTKTQTQTITQTATSTKAPTSSKTPTASQTGVSETKTGSSDSSGTESSETHGGLFDCGGHCPCLFCWIMLIIGFILGAVVSFIVMVLLIRRERDSNGWG